MLTRWLLELAGSVRTAAGESVLLGWLFPGERTDPDAGEAHRARLRFRVMRLQEESLWRRMLAWLWQWLLKTSAGALGRFLLIASAVSLTLYFAESSMLPFSFIPIPEESGFPPCGISIPPLKISMPLILLSEL